MLYAQGVGKNEHVEMRNEDRYKKKTQIELSDVKKQYLNEKNHRMGLRAY